MKATFKKGFKVPNRGPKITPFIEYWVKSIKYNGNSVDIVFDDVPKSKIVGLSVRYLHSVDNSNDENPEPLEKEIVPVENLEINGESLIGIQSSVEESFVSPIAEGSDLTNVAEENSEAVDQLLNKNVSEETEIEKNAEETTPTIETEAATEAKEVKTRRKQSRQSPE